MEGLPIGSKIRMTSGEAKVLEFKGDGAQGYVYRVEFNGHEYALKWYKINDFLKKIRDVNGFYNNLQKNVINGAPSNVFLWPLGISEKQMGSFGYIMNLRPKKYFESTKFFKGQVHFANFSPVVNACINIILGFRSLHNRGYSYQDINNGNFFIVPDTGEVLICDNDNVCPDKQNFGIQGKQRWMAPEIVTGKKEFPDTESDLFSLSVILFRILFNYHPLEGARTSQGILNKKEEILYFGTDPIYSLDPEDRRNRPMPGADINFRHFFPLYPRFLLDRFSQAFSKDVMLLRKARIQEIVWQDDFFRAKAALGNCPYCGTEIFYAEKGNSRCYKCGKIIPVKNRLSINGNEMALFPGMKLYQGNISANSEDLNSIVGEVISAPNLQLQLGIRNQSDKRWRLYRPDGTITTISPNQIVSVVDRYEIDFAGKKGRII